MKNIQAPSEQSYKLSLIDKIESVIKRMRWKAYFFMENKATNEEEPRKETYGFKSKYHPSQSKYLKAFEKDLFNIVDKLKFRPMHNEFQQQLKEDITQIKSSPDFFIFADKTNNIYKSTPQEYQKLLFNNVTKSYQKSTELVEKSINMEAKHISKQLDLDNRIESFAKNPAFISLKNHKPNFQSTLPCRLINPSKSDIGKVSKSILDKIKQNLRSMLEFNQWKNSENVIDWFKKIENKNNHVFIKFDIAEFYPSISETILQNAIRFAEDHVEITNEE